MAIVIEEIKMLKVGDVLWIFYPSMYAIVQITDVNKSITFLNYIIITYDCIIGDILVNKRYMRKDADYNKLVYDQGIYYTISEDMAINYIKEL